MNIFVNLILFFILIVSTNSKIVNKANGKETKKISDFFTLVKPLQKGIQKANISQLCKKHLDIYLRDLNNLQLWALKMYDSTGQWPSGLLNGNVHQNGDFTQCINIDETLSDHSQDHIVGKYCQIVGTAEAILPNSTVSQIMDLVHSHSLITSTIYDDEYYVPTFSEITWSFCIPSSCKEEDLYNIVSEIIKPYNLTTGLDIRIKKIPYFMCKTIEDDFMVTPFGKYYLTIFAMFVAFSIYASKFDNARNKYKFLSAFSVRNNYKILMSPLHIENDITCLYGLRTIFSLIIYLIHRSMFSLQLAKTNRTEIYPELVGHQSMLFRAFLNHVDIFVIMSGLLTSYYCTFKLLKGQQLNIPSMYVKRYLKFAPFYIIFILGTYSINFKAGPHSQRFGDPCLDVCRNKSLLKSILMIDNFDGMSKMCYPPAHQLFTDWQMYLLSPFIIQLFWKYPKYQVKILFGLISVLGVYKALSLYANRLTPIYYNGATVKEFGMGSDYIYINPLHRLIPYIAGIYFGIFLNTSGKKLVLTFNQKIIGSLFAIGCAYYCFYGFSELAYDNYEYEPIKSSIYSVLQPVLWSYAVCWLIFLCHTGHLPRVNNFLSWHYFSIFSKISYPFYLLQITILFHNLMSDPTPTYGIRKFDLNEFVLLIGYSIFATVIIIMPIFQLSMLYLQSDQKKPKTNITINGEKLEQNEKYE